MNKPLHFYKLQLEFRSVQIEVLDADEVLLTKATGFIIKEHDGFYLYTCWHVVTGYDPHNVQINGKISEKFYLKINIQDAQQRQGPPNEVTAIGGRQTYLLPIYDKVDLPRNPLWLQDESYLPHEDLEAINIKIPFWHDAVKFKLPEEVKLTDMQVISVDEFYKGMLSVGDKILIAGYPYGFSATGKGKPTPVVLTRHVAARRLSGTRNEFLLDGPGTPGMSGAPVFIEKDNMLSLVGIYTGNIYPDFNEETNISGTTLGRCCNLILALMHVPFVPWTEVNKLITDYVKE